MTGKEPGMAGRRDDVGGPGTNVYSQYEANVCYVIPGLTRNLVSNNETD